MVSIEVKMLRMELIGASVKIFAIEQLHIQTLSDENIVLASG